MRLTQKFKLAFLILLKISLVSNVFAYSHKIDSAIIYYKKINGGYQKVDTKNQCDFFCIISAPDSGGNHYNLKEYYRDGTRKLVGKISQKMVTEGGQLALDGRCTSFSINGVKQSVAQYSEGYKNGDEYLFYPNGKLYAIEKNTLVRGAYNEKVIHYECYDTMGAMICKEGNGHWLIYDDEFRSVILEGSIKDGYRNGYWNGKGIVQSDSIKYVYRYKNGVENSAVGYDKSGKEYPFVQDIEAAYYWSGPFNFLRAVQTHLDLPKDSNGKRMSADNVVVTFIIEKDGHTSNIEPTSGIDPALKSAILNAFSKCKNWTPRKNFGIPVRAKIILSLKYLTGYSDRYFTDEIYYGEEQLSNN